MENPTETCQCKSDGRCERYGRWMGGRLRSICNGTAEGVSPAQAEQYRRAWAAQAAGAAPAPPTATVARCPYLWKRARDEQGNVKTVICQSPG